MNKVETAEILSVLKAAYPQFYSNIGSAEANKIVNLWAEMFEDESLRDVALAVKSMLASRTNTFPPNIGEVKAQLVKMRTPNEMTAQEAWNLVAKAIRNGVYGSQEEFQKLPKNVQRLVGSPQQIREWALMEADTVSSVIASNFQRSYNVRQQSDKEYAALPSSVKQMVTGLADCLAMGDGT